LCDSGFSLSRGGNLCDMDSLHSVCLNFSFLFAYVLFDCVSYL
jgi:hypothetical protein